MFLGSRSSPGNALFLEGKESSECCDDPKCSVQKKGAKAGGSIGRKNPWETGRRGGDMNTPWQVYFQPNTESDPKFYSTRPVGNIHPVQPTQMLWSQIEPQEAFLILQRVLEPWGAGQAEQDGSGHAAAALLSHSEGSQSLGSLKANLQPREGAFVLTVELTARIKGVQRN